MMLKYAGTVVRTKWCVVIPSLSTPLIGQGKTEVEAKARAFDWLVDNINKFNMTQLAECVIVKDEK